MPAGDRQFDRRSSSLVMIGGSVAVAVLAFQPAFDASNTDRAAPVETTGVETPGPSPSCREADRATVARLAAFLERNGPTDAPVPSAPVMRSTWPVGTASTIGGVDWRTTGGWAAG